MRKFVYLVNTELNRVVKFLIPTLLIYLGLQIMQIFIKMNNVLRNIKENSYSSSAIEDGSTYEQAIKGIGKVYNVHSFLDPDSIIIMGFLLIVGVILLYSILIWYREWFGSNKTIYTLLALPIDRMQIYYAKLLSVVILIATAIATLIISFFINYLMMLWRFPKELIEEYSFNKLFKNFVLNSILPIDYREFILYIVIVLGLLTAIFLGILLERSYKIKGLVGGAVFIVFYLFVYVLILESGFFYNREALIVSVAWGVLNILGHISWSKKLINTKISV